jgi:hypothetical protein
MRTILSAAGVVALTGAAFAQQDNVVVDMSGIEIAFPFNDQIRDSVQHPADGTPEMINLSDGYEFQISGDARVVVLLVEFYDGPIEPLFNFLEPGLGNVLSGYVRNSPGGLPPAGGKTWTESFGGGLFGVEINVTLEIETDAAGVVTIGAVDITSDLGILGSIEFSNATARLTKWEPTPTQFNEWHFDGDLGAVPESEGGAIRFLDDSAFGDILVGEDNDGTPDPTIPKDVTAAQSAFVDTAMEPGVPPLDGMDDTVLLTSPAFNLADPNKLEHRRGVGLVCFPATKPQYPGSFIGKWSMVWDLLIPSSSWYEDFPANTTVNPFLAALVQTDPDNDNGADLWLRYQGGQPGIIWAKDGDNFSSGFLPLPIAPDSWFRLAVVADEFQRGVSRVFVDGAFVGEIGSDWVAAATDPTAPTYADGEALPTGAWDAWGEFPSPWSRSSGALNPGFDGEPVPAPMNSTFCMFADLRFGGSQPVYLANYLFTDGLLEDSEVSDLGGPNAAGIMFTDGGCNPADLSEPFGVLDFSDVLAFLTAFGSSDPAADLAAPFGVYDFSDVISFLGAFGGGCP